VFHVEHWDRITAARSDSSWVVQNPPYTRLTPAPSAVKRSFDALVAGRIASIRRPASLSLSTRCVFQVRGMGPGIQEGPCGGSRELFVGLLIQKESIPSRHVRLSEAV
jgi:hypothetical protein